MRNSRIYSLVWTIAVLVSLVVPAPGAEVVAQGATGPELPVEGASLLPVDTPVGVIPGPDGCPPGIPTVAILMDDENTNNANAISGWTGAIHQVGSTTLWIFCQVDGEQFRPFGVLDNENADYAVVRLGFFCPEGSVAFSRHFDNENTNNRNRAYTHTGPNRWQSDLHLHFCFFPGQYYEDGNSEALQTDFPALPFEYGVFAASDFFHALARGTIVTDDENTDNRNRMTFDPGLDEYQVSAILNIVDDNVGPSTRLETALVHRVAPGTPGNGVPDFVACPATGFCRSNPRPLDLTISIQHISEPTAAQRAPYEQIIGFMADGVYEMSNGTHKVRNVVIYQAANRWNAVHVQWVQATHPAAHMSGYHFGGHIYMGDVFGNVNYLDTDRQRDGGYTLAHELGHYYYGLKDEYRGSKACDLDDDPYFRSPCLGDVPVVFSVMSSQWLAINGDTVDYRWLNFSSAANNTKQTAQHRVYEASGWEVLKRGPGYDPHQVIVYVEKKRILGYKYEEKEHHLLVPRQPRFHFPELATVAPPDRDSLPTLEMLLPNAQNQARSLLNIAWSPWVETIQPGVLIFGRRLLSTGSRAIPFRVEPGAAEIEVLARHRSGVGKSVTYTLRNPAQQVVEPATCTFADANDAPCSWSIENPLAGEWVLDVVTANPPVELDVLVTVPRQTPGVAPYTAWIQSVGGNRVDYPEPAIIIAGVEQQLPLAKVGFSAQMQLPNGTIVPLEMHDNGVAPDAVAEDGVYTGYLPYDQDGEYWLEAFFDNDAGTAVLTTKGTEHGDGETTPFGARFQRVATELVYVQGTKQDDHGNTPAAATAIDDENTPVAGRIDYAADVDVFKVTPTRSGDTVVRISGVGQAMDPVLRVLAANGTTMLDETRYVAGSPFYPFLVVDAQAGTPFYVAVSHATPGATQGTYFVSAGPRLPGVTENEPPPAPVVRLPITLSVDSGSVAMQLYWNVTNDPNVSHYRVRRSPENGQNLQPIVDNQTQTTYFDQGSALAPLVKGTTYCYQVEAMTGPQTVAVTSNVACGRFGLLDVWVPDSIGKNGDTVIVPINIRNAHGLRIGASDVWLDFDSTVLASQAISRTALTAEYAWAYSVQPINATTSRVRIAYIHSNLNELPPELHGEGSLFWLTFRVNGQPGTTSPLDLREFIQGVGGSSIQNQSLANVDLQLTDGTFKVDGTAAYMLGDVNGDGIVSAVDAALASRLANGERTPTTLEGLAGDANGNSRLDTADVTMILHYAAHQAWPEAPSAQQVAAAQTVASSIRIAQAQGRPGETIRVAVVGDQLANMAGASLMLAYDPRVVVEVVRVQKGALTSGFTTLEHHASGTGLLSIGLAHDGEVSGSGEIVLLDLRLAPNAPLGSTVLRLADAKVNNRNGRDFVTGSAANTLARQSAALVVLPGSGTSPDPSQGKLYLPTLQR